MPRIPRFIRSANAMIPESAEGTYGDVNLTNLGLFAQGIQTIALDQTHAIPDMLQPDFTLEQNLSSQDNNVANAAFDQWIGFYSALVLDLNHDIQATTYTAGMLQNPNGALFLQALGRSLAARGIGSITFYSGMVTVNGMDRQCAIGYSYQDEGVKHYCPAANLRFNITPLVHQGCFNGAEKVFCNPMQLLLTPAFHPQAAALVGNLNGAMATLPICLRAKVGAFIAGFAGIADGTIELRPFGGPVNLGLNYHAIASWFAPRLLVLSNAWNGMWINTYASLPVKDANGNLVADTAIVAPLTQQYAQQLLNLRAQGAGAAAGYQAVRNCFEAPNASATVYNTEAGDRYQLRFSYMGTGYTVTYDTADCVTLNMGMPYVAVWPPRDVAAWSNYYVYSRFTDNAHASQITLSPLTPAGGGFVAHVPAVDRTADTREIWDYVTKVDRFPHFIEVQCGGAAVGLLMPRETVAAAAAVPSVVAIDFGSTNTIAYSSSAGAVPSPINIGSALLEVCGDNHDHVKATLNFSNPDAFAHAQFLSMINTFGPPHIPGAAFLEWEESTIPFAEAIEVTPERAKHLFLGLKKPGMLTEREALLKQLAMIYRWKIADAGGALGPGVTWRFAYPRSMPNQEKLALQMGFNTIFGINGMATQFCSEARAVGAYITSPAMVAAVAAKGYAPVSGSNGYMIMDIGGGTVDYSLWQIADGQNTATIRCESSMWQVAGAFAVQEMIQHKHIAGMPANTALLWQLWSVGPNAIVQPDPQVNALKNAIINSLRNGTPLAMTQPLHIQLIAYMEARNDPAMTGYVNEIDHMFDTAWSTNVIAIMAQIQSACRAAMIQPLTEVKQFIANMELYFSLLVYFAGELMGVAINEGRLQPNPNGVFSLALAGNGSRLLSYLPDYQIGAAGAGVDFRASVLHGRLLKFFMAGLAQHTETKIRVQIVEPLMAKGEVAYGLCAAPAVVDGPPVVTNWQQEMGNPDIRERAASFAIAYYQITGVDIGQKIAGNVDAVLANIAGKGRDEAFRDLIHHTLD